MNKLFFTLLFFVTALMSAQNGTISGTVIDKDFNDDPVAFASIQVKGTTKGAQSDMDGKFSISIAPGTYTLLVSFAGMKKVEVPVTVEAGNTTSVTVPMTAEALLDDVIITVTKTRESEEALLKEKQESVTIVQSIGAEELSKKGVSDAEGAVTKVSVFPALGISTLETGSEIFL